MPTFNVDAFSGGRARSSVGDEGCVVANTETQLNMKTPPPALSEVASLVANTSLTVTKHIFFVPGVVLELQHPVDTELSIMVEVSAVTSVSPTDSRLDILPGYVFDATFVGADVSVAQNFVRPEVVYGSAAVPLHFLADYTVGAVTYQNVQVPGARWVENQWAGQTICLGGDFDGAGTLPVFGNTGDHLIIITGGGLSTVDDLVLSIAQDFSVATPYASRVPIWKLTALGRGVTTLFEPTLDMERKGTPWYGNNHMLGGGQGQPLGNTFTAKDTGVTITTPNLVDLRGKAVSLSNQNKTLTLSLPTDMVPFTLAGKYLNPNQNQTDLFMIVSNTADTITVESPMDGAFEASEVAYVIGERVAVKYQRLLSQMQKYVNPDARLHIFFA